MRRVSEVRVRVQTGARRLAAVTTAHTGDDVAGISGEKTVFVDPVNETAS